MFAIPLAVAIGAYFSHSLPGLLEGGLLGLAMAIIVSSRCLIRLEFRIPRNRALRFFALGIAVGTPMFLFGFAMAHWAATSEEMTKPAVIVLLVLVAAVSGAFLQGRLPAYMSAILSLWIGFDILSGIERAVPLFTVSCASVAYFCFQHFQRVEDEEGERVAQMQAQYRAESFLAEFEQTGQGWFWQTDRRGMITYVSPRIAKQLGAEDGSLIGRPFTCMFQLDSQESESERTLNFHLSTRSSFSDLDVLAATDEAEDRWWSVTGRPVLDRFNNFQGFRGSGSDLTESKRSQRYVTQLARYDSLTKLANRFQLTEWLEKILASPQPDARACAIFMLDLDRFKDVNDTLGHPAGDALLQQVADRLRTTVGALGSVGRLGGDEFKVILPGRHATGDLANLARRIIENLSQPYSIEGQRVIIGASIGISLCPDNASTSEELIRNADLALYAAKDGGRGRHHFYADDLHSDAEERRELEQDLRDAITGGGFELHYQPQVSTMTEKISGFEALLRWNHPKLGYLSPAKFIPVAEDAGLIGQIGEWALRTACHELAKWPESVRVAVNVSPLQFANPALPAIVTNALASAGVDPKRLELEITESVFLNDDQATEAMFTALKGLGVRLALDDFGTGYSSLGYLKKAPFDKIKIDQSFVRGATVSGSRNGAIISSIVTLAESLGMETTAEGVETLDELDLSRMLGCSHIQGYIYEKALTPLAAADRLKSGLSVLAQGPKSARRPRQTMFRKVLLESGGHQYQGTIRNISPTGALIEGLWNVPPGTQFSLSFSRDNVIVVTTRWCKEDRMGVEFSHALELDGNGAVIVQPSRPVDNGIPVSLLRKAG